MMEIEYDEQANAAYIQLSQASVHRTPQLQDDFIVDVDQEGRLVGLEILNATRHLAADLLSKT